MPARPIVSLRLELGSQFASPVTPGGALQASLSQVLGNELAERLDGLGLPGTPEVEIVINNAQSTSVRWFVHGRECSYPEEVPLGALSFVQGKVLGPQVYQEHGQGWMGAIRSAAPAGALSEDELVQFFRLFATMVLELHPSVLLGHEQAEAYAEQIVEAGFPGDSTGVQAWLAPLLENVLDMGLSIADASQFLPILRDGQAQDRALPDLVEDVIAQMTPDTFEIHANLQLIKRLSLVAAGGVKLIPMMRDRLFYELGMRYPPLRFVVSDTLPENAFAFKIHAWPTMSRIGLGADQLLVNDTVDRIELLSIKGSAAINPGNGSECSVISTADGAVAESAGLTTWNEQDYLILCLSAELRRRAARFINVRTVEDDLRRLEPFPNLVGYAKEKIGLEQMARVLRNLVSEEVSIRNLRAILEHMLEFDYIRCDSTKFIVLDDRMPTKRKPEMSWLRDPRVLADFVRTRMKRYISDKYARGGSTLKAYLLDAGIEGLLERNEARGTELSETERDQVLAGIARELGRVPPSAQASPLLTTIEVRSALRKVTKLRFPQLPVLCYQELTPDSSIEPLARIAV